MSQGLATPVVHSSLCTQSVVEKVYCDLGDSSSLRVDIALTRIMVCCVSVASQLAAEEEGSLLPSLR